MPAEPGGLEPIGETEEHDMEAPAHYDHEYVEFDTYDTREDTGDEGDN